MRKWCNGAWIAGGQSIPPVKELAIDSRSIEDPAAAMFVAIVTGVRNGHDYLPDAYSKGVRCFLVSKTIDVAALPDAHVLLVKDTLTALQQIAAGHRRQFDMPVIGITGSNGKTIVKEWLYQLLGGEFQTVRSPRSYNSQVGVPLSVWQMSGEHQLGIFEAGISQPGEMERLEKIIAPTIGIFTNIGEAHSEGFMNQRQKINEKLVLFRNADYLIYCYDHAELNECVAQYLAHVRSARGADAIKPFTWSAKQDADLRITHVNKQNHKTHIQARYSGRDMAIDIPFTDDASVENAIHCWCAALLLGVSEETISRNMEQLQSVSMRLELRKGINDCTIINDAYNSDLTSLQLALTYLEQQKQHLHRTVILSDMLQVGRPDSDLYEEVAALISRRNVQRFIGIGPALYKNKAAFRKHKKVRSIFFKSTADFLKNFHLLTFNREAVLLKGARVFAFEKVALLLEQQVHQTVMNIDLSAIRHNLDVFRAELRPGVKVMAMVKAFGYGSGSYEIAGLLQQAGVNYLAVAYTDEGIALRKAGITMPVMVMSPDSSSFDRMIAWKLEPEIFNFRSLHLFTQMAQTFQAKNYPIHIKLDTGMHRLGFEPQDIEDLIARINENDSLTVASIFSHLAASEDPAEDAFTRTQAARFDEMSNRILAALPYKPLRHLCNSAGIVRHHALHYDMVRPGLGLYGVDGSSALKNKLRQISTLTTTIAQVRHVPAGESVGYGHKNILQHDTRVATISIGYADGYLRALGHGKAYVMIHGRQARTLGSICMDMCMVDVTDIPEAREGDQAIVFGADPTVTQVAQWAGTISYEIMTGISQRVKRIYINEE